MTEGKGKFKCLICGCELDDGIIEFVSSQKPIICPKCNTKHEICEVNGELCLKPWELGFLELGASSGESFSLTDMFIWKIAVDSHHSKKGNV